MDIISIQYHFTLPDGSKKVFGLQLDEKNLELTSNDNDNLPDWTDLNFNQCPNCLLTTETHPHCPLAVKLVGIVEKFEEILSFDKVHVEVVTKERSISQNTTAQRGISSLMGLIIATSGCPHTAFFKPMARFHLPLASGKETLYRATSMYLLAQYFLKREGDNADLELKRLSEIYKDIQVINISVAKRLRAASNKDSTINAIILLDAFAKSLPTAIGAALKEIRYLFTPFLEKH